MKTLYKLNNNGKLLQWDIVVEENMYWAVYGQVGGKLQADTPTVCEGKNVGKANETTPEEQALLEAKAKYKKQIDMKGYVEDIDEVEKFVFTPMLAHPYDKYGKKLPHKLSCSPKMDGLRCYITKDGAYSRNGNIWVSTKYIEDSLKSIFEVYPTLVLDGELYCHKLHDDFNKIVSLAKKTKHISDSDWVEIKNKLEYHVFDCYFRDEPNMTFKNRYEFLQKNIFACHFNNIILVKSYDATKDDFHTLFQKFIEDGYEGIMLRDPESVYECKRSYGLQKYKEFQDNEFEIVDIEGGSGNRSGMFGRMILTCDVGVFEANARGNEEYYRELLQNKEQYIGKMATVRFQNYTPEGIPRFGVVITIRDYE